MEIAFALTRSRLMPAPVVAYDDLDIAAAMLGMQRKGGRFELARGDPLGRRLDAVVEAFRTRCVSGSTSFSMTVLSSSLASPKPQMHQLAVRLAKIADQTRKATEGEAHGCMRIDMTLSCSSRAWLSSACIACSSRSAPSCVSSGEDLLQDGLGDHKLAYRIHQAVELGAPTWRCRCEGCGEESTSSARRLVDAASALAAVGAPFAHRRVLLCSRAKGMG